MEQEYDIHIECYERYYCGDVAVTCVVTYPSSDPQHPISIDYDTGDESLTKAIERATKDIAAYMEDPEEWVRAYIEHSSEDWRKLKQAQASAEEYQERLDRAKGDVLREERWLTEKQREIAALQAKIEQEKQ